MSSVWREIERGEGVAHVDGIFNATLFYNVNDRTTVEFETNFVFGERERSGVLLIPQIDFELTDHCELQFGGGVAIEADSTRPLLASRLIYSR